MFKVDATARVEDAPGFHRMFAPGRLTLGLFFPIEAFRGDQPAMRDQEQLATRAQALDFAALWFRDVPLRDPAFGDVGQVFDPFVYLGHIAAVTHTIALGTAAIVLPLRHPLHTAKAAASVDQLGQGRLVLGVASGDRPSEFPAFGVSIDERGALFRDNLMVLQRALGESFPLLDSRYGRLHGVDLVPKATTREIPVLVTGRSGQDLDWIARHAHGWLSYPRAPSLQARVVNEWREAQHRVRGRIDLPFAQSLYIDLDARADLPEQPIHLGYRLGRRALVALLARLHAAGVQHVILNLKYGSRAAPKVMRELADALPAVHAATRAATASA
jgi:luciferase-type oxidoreductase